MFSEKSGSTSQITTNSIGATYQFQTWLKNNNYHSLEDGVGWQWFLEVESRLAPNPEDTQGGVCYVKVLVSTQLDSKSLVETEVFDDKEDKRLLEMIGEAQVPVTFNRPEKMFLNVEEARRDLVEEVNKIREMLQSDELGSIKRKLVGQWVDNKCLF